MLSFNMPSWLLTVTQFHQFPFLKLFWALKRRFLTHEILRLQFWHQLFSLLCTWSPYLAATTSPGSFQPTNKHGRKTWEFVVFTSIRPVMLLLWLVWWWFLYWKEVCCFSHCLVLVDWNGYSPENQHGTWKWTPGKGESFWKPSFSGSMLVFGVGDLLWVVFFTGKMKHQFSWAQLFIGMLSCRVCQNPGSQWVKSTRKSIRLLLYKGNPFLSFRNSTVNQFLGRRYISNVPPWFLLHWYVSRHRHRCPRGICNSYEWIIYGRLKGFGNMSSSSNMGSWRVPGLFIIPCLVRIYKRSSTPNRVIWEGGWEWKWIQGVLPWRCQLIDIYHGNKVKLRVQKRKSQ